MFAGSCPYAHFRFIVVKKHPHFSVRLSFALRYPQTLHCLLFGFIFWACLFISLDSNSSFTEPSFLTGMTIGETKYLTEHSSSFSMCLWASKLSLSLSTLLCKMRDIFLPFCWMGIKVLEKFGSIFHSYVCALRCGKCYGIAYWNVFASHQGHSPWHRHLGAPGC